MSETNSAQDVSRTTSRSTTKGMDDQERNRSGLPPGIQGDFIKATPEPSSGEFHEHLPDRLRRVVKRFTQNSATTQIMAGVVLFDAYCNCADIDARADGGSSPPLVLQLGAIFCLVLYSLEAILILYSQGRSALRDVIFLIDLSVILCGYAEIILSELLASEELAARISPLRLLRLARVMRLLRLLRKTRALRELQKLVIMMSTCIKALLWSFIFCFIVMTVWAMLIVEMINPIIKEMNGASGAFADCDECLRATSSVMNANLLLFKTVIAGDSWGQIAVPVIQEHPATAIIFMGSLLTLVFGVLNLIVAVVVDTFADARDRDILNLAEEMEQDVEADRRYLERMFERIDYEHTGQLSLEQLVEGARRDAEFQSRLRVMDIDEHDLVQLFDMIDTDQSGFIESAEFVRPLSRWVHDSRTAPRFIKYNLVRALQKQDEIQAEQEIMKKEMQSNFQELLQKLEDLQPEPQKADPLVNVRAPSWERLKTESMELVSWTPIAKRHESIEQPQPCRRVTLKKLAESEAGVHEAMARLEQLVLHATEMAMKETTGLIKEVLLDCGSLSQELPKAHLAVDLKAD